MSDDDKLPKQDRLIKLMGMTGSSNDGEALVALRMATKLLNEAGWDWARLIEGKIKVIADPFASVPKPQSGGGSSTNPYGAKPSAPPPPPPQRPAAPPPPAWQGHSRWSHKTPVHVHWNPDIKLWQTTPYVAPAAPVNTWGANIPNAAQPAKHNFGIGKNRFGGPCYCCGTDTPPQMGRFFKPGAHNPSALMKNVVICDVCDSNPKTKIPNRAAPAKAGATLQDLF